MSSVGIPQAYSITSRPRATSPIASVKTLPCSATSSRARSSRCAFRSSRIEKKSSARRPSDIARQAGNASRAAATAASTSSTEAKSTDPVCSPVAGLYTGPLRPDCPSYGLPPIQWWISLTASGAWIVSVISSSSLSPRAYRVSR